MSQRCKSDVEDSHPFPLMAEAYLDAPENVKGEVFQIILREVTCGLECLRKLARLDRGGNRVEVLAKRPAAHRIRLDAALTGIKEPAPQLLAASLRHFLGTRSDEWEKMSNVAEGHGLSQIERRDLLAVTIGSDPTARLLASIVVELDLADVMEPPLPDPLHEVPQMRDQLATIAVRLRVIADALDQCDYAESESDSASIGAAAQLCSHIRESVQKAAERLGEPMPKWENTDEFDKLVAGFANRLGELEKDDRGAEFLQALAEAVLTTDMKFSSERMREAATSLREEAARELENAANVEHPPVLPRADGVGPHWLRQVAQLPDSEKAELITAVKGVQLAAFGEFLETIDPAWIDVSEKKEAPDRPTIHTPGAGEVLVRMEPAGPGDSAQEVAGPGPSQLHEDSGEATAPQASDVSVEEGPSSSPSADPNPNFPNETVLPVRNAAEEGLEARGAESTGQVEICSFGLPLPELAAACLRDLDEGKNSGRLLAAELVCKLLDLERTGLSYQMAACLQETQAAALLPPPQVLKALAVTTALRSATPSALQPIQEIFSAIHPEAISWNDMETWKDAVRLLVFASTMPMALRSPLTTADDVLGELHLGKWPKLREIAAAATAFAQHRLEVSWDTLSENLSRIEWEKRIEEFRRLADQRWQQCNARTITFQGATEVWKHWLKPAGLLHQLLDPIRKGELQSAKLVSALIATIDFEDLLDQAQSSLGQRTKIVGGALKVLRRQLDEVAVFAQDWTQLVNAEPRGESDFVRVQLEKLRKSLLHSAESAKKEVRDSMGDLPDFLTQSCGTKAIEAIDACLGLFGSAATASRCASTVEEATAGCLLEIPSLYLGSDWECAASSASILRSILEALAEGGAEGPDARVAFQRHCDNGDHLASQRLIERMLQKGADPAEIESLEHARRRSLEAHQSALLERIEDIEGRLSAALQNGLVHERTVSDGLSAIAEIRGDLRSPDGLLDFVTPGLRLNSISAALDLERSKKVDEVRGRLTKTAMDDSSKARLEEIVASGDLHLANDYLDKIEDGQPLPEADSDTSENVFLRFFRMHTGIPGLFQSLLKHLSEGRRSEREIVDAVEERRDVAGLKLASVSGAHASEYAEVLKVWFSLKEPRKLPSAEAVSRILRGLGFNVTSVRPEQKRNRHWIYVDTEPLLTPPVPAFGSEAKGRYRILCDYGIAAENELQAAMESGAPAHGADLVFYFGRMNEKVRQSFAQVLRNQRRTVAVVDDIVMLALAEVRGRKLDVLLELALPFSGMMPYTTQGSLLPPEMFFGRQREVAQLESTSTDSSCLLYGGRQIGKSVLLRHVERRVNSRAGSVAVFNDLKSIGLGVSRKPSELWTEMARQLRERETGIFPGTMPALVSPAWFAEKVRAWLAVDPQHRILMLLDEADAFLEADGKSNESGGEAFQICTQLRDLMVETKHRFKVVLAGLHNVQRSTRTANNPLAQYGTPICVGPLLAGGEAREAQALIEKPLARLGIFFDSVRLVVRILAQTNYYPNLIQIYCQTLVDHVRERQSRKGVAHPVPYFVSSAEVEELYERRQLRDILHKRFELTLELDPRFRLIAYLLALHDRDTPGGMESAAIRKEAMEWWAVGFRQPGLDGSGQPRGIALEDFETLLDEMEGLGILRHTGPGATYRLRSPNVVSLLGTESQIEGVLLGSEHWEAPKAYSPETFRNPQTAGGVVFRSPITANQEARLRRERSDVILLAGSQALGLDQIGEALRSIIPHFHSVEADDLNGFRREIDGLVNKRLGKQEGKTIALVPATTGWDASWTTHAEEKLAKLRNTSAHLGVVFLLDPAQAWRERALFAGWERGRTIVLNQWSEDTVGPWLNEASISPNNALAREAVATATGHWPVVLRQLARDVSGTLREPEVLADQGRILLGRLAQTLDLHRVFGLDTGEPMRVLRELFDYGEFTESDASCIVPAEDRRILAEALAWAEAMSLVSRIGQDISVDPIVRVVLERA